MSGGLVYLDPQQRQWPKHSFDGYSWKATVNVGYICETVGKKAQYTVAKTGKTVWGGIITKQFEAKRCFKLIRQEADRDELLQCDLFIHECKNKLAIRLWEETA